MPAPTERYPSHQAASGPPPRRSAGGGGINGVRLAAVMLIVGAVWSVVQRRVLGTWLTVEPVGPADYSAAGAQIVLAIALFQGSEAARKFVLWMTGLAAAVLIVALPFLATEARFWLLGGSLLLGAAGLFGLLVGRGPSAVRAVFSVVAMLAAWAGSTAGVLLVLGRLDRETIQTIQEWAAPEHTYEDQATGLSIALPEGWVSLKSGNPIVASESAELALAHTRVSALAVLASDEKTPASTLDHYLDAILRARREEMPGVEEERRADATIGKAPARKVWTTWTEKRARFRGSTTVWQDGRTWYRLTAWSPAIQGPQADGEIDALERAVTFSSPQDASLKETLVRIGAACPLLSPAAVRLLTTSVPRGAGPEAYFRQGYQWAIQGLPLLEPAAGQELRSITQRVFGSLPEAKRARLGTYVEKLRYGPATTPDEDRAMNELMAGGIRQLPEGDQLRLRELTERAIDVGRLR